MKTLFIGIAAIILLLPIIVCLAPLALVYFLFSRFCSLIESFRPCGCGHNEEEEETVTGRDNALQNKIFAGLLKYANNAGNSKQ